MADGGIRAVEIRAKVKYIIGDNVRKQEQVIELIHEILGSYAIGGKSHVEKIKINEDFFDQRFLIFIFENQLALNHYNCNTSMEQLGIDHSLDDMIRKAYGHLKECNK